MLAILHAAPVAAASIPQLVRDGEYRQAVVELRQKEAQRPLDARVKRNLGIALLEAGEASEAIPKLRDAHLLDTDDTTTLFHLGRAAEATQNYDLALKAYGAYLDRTDKDAAAVRARIHAITEQSALASVRAAIADEKGLNLPPPTVNTIAVPEFHAPATSDTLRPLARGLAVVLMTDLGRLPELQVVERARIHALMEELKLAESPGMIEPSSAPRMGRLLAARRFAQGSLAPLGSSDVQIGAVLIDASDASARSSGEPVSGDLTEVLALEKRLVFQVIDSLGIVLSEDVRKEIGEPPTKSFQAFLAFSRGVEFEDRGLPDRALEAYAQAVRIDPKFRMARMRRDELAISPASQTSVERASVRQAFDTNATLDRLLQAGTEIGIPTVPLSSTGGLTPAAKAGTIPLTIRGQVPR